MFVQDFNFLYSRSLKCPLDDASYALRIGVSVTELQSAEFFISHTSVIHFDCAYWKFYNVCARSLFAETIPYTKLFILLPCIVYNPCSYVELMRDSGNEDFVFYECIVKRY